MIVYLIGFSGCGKSTIGRRAARIAGCRFVDTDREVEKVAGASVSQIFAERGEAYFRELETAVIETLVRSHAPEFSEGSHAPEVTGGGNAPEVTEVDHLKNPASCISKNPVSRISKNPGKNADGADVIVATGGGLPCFGGNMELLKRTGLTVYMESSNQRLFNMLRLCRGRRPLVAGLDDERLRSHIELSMQQRGPCYRQAAVRVECDGMSDAVIARRIADLLY